MKVTDALTAQERMYLEHGITLVKKTEILDDLTDAEKALVARGIKVVKNVVDEDGTKLKITFSKDLKRAT